MKNIDKFELIPKSMKLAVYGGSKRGQAYVRLLQENRPDVTIVCYIDSFSENLDSTPPVIPVSKFKNIYSEIDGVVICSSSLDEILATIYRVDNIFFEQIKFYNTVDPFCFDPNIYEISYPLIKTSLEIYNNNIEETLKWLSVVIEEVSPENAFQFIRQCTNLLYTKLRSAKLEFLKDFDMNFGIKVFYHFYIALRQHLQSQGATLLLVDYEIKHDGLQELPDLIQPLLPSEIVGNIEYQKIIWKELDHWDSTYNSYVSYIPRAIQTDRGPMMTDQTNPYCNIVCGNRVTTDTPANYDNIIYMYGNSRTFGFGAEDAHTTASFLQKKINLENKSGTKYTVLNLGMVGSSLIESSYKILSNKYKEGDIVLLYGIEIVKLLKNKLQSSEALLCRIPAESSGVPVRYDGGHLSYKGNELVADAIYKQIFADEGLNSFFIKYKNIESDTNFTNFVEKYMSITSRYYKSHVNSIVNNFEFNKFITNLKNFPPIDGKTGSIVINCNPFTKGHLFLIEYAAQQVDRLFVFVVEEDRSYFKFKDRFFLTAENCAHLDNVIVLPSGSFIISRVTFEDYFNKDDLQCAKCDASNDLAIFAQYIAPTLNIDVRFIGDEPICLVTNQYNKQMKHILPLFGLHVKEIKRKEIHKKPISASMVRRLFENNSFSDIKCLVPRVTYDYLLELFHLRINKSM